MRVGQNQLAIAAGLLVAFGVRAGRAEDAAIVPAEPPATPRAFPAESGGPTACIVPDCAALAAADAGRRRRYLGVGYEAGNGLGNAGLLVDVSPFGHVAFDLQMSWLYNKLGASGWGVAPGVRAFLIGDGRSTPYIAAGYVRYRVKFDNGDVGWGNSVFANVGYDWRLPAGFSILVGAGIIYSGNLTTSATARTMVFGEDGLRPNLEASFRYMFP